MEKEIFKQSIMGFDRSQVIKYIDDLLREMTEKEIEYKNKQEELEKEIKLLQNSIGKNDTELLEAKEAVELLKKGIIEAAKNNQGLQEKLSKYKEFIILKETAYTELKEKHDSKTEEIEKIHNENEYWKLRQEEISTTLIEAKLTAKEIVNDANNKAEEIKNKFKEDADNLSKEFVGVKRSIEDIEKQIEASFSKVSGAISLIDKSSEELEERIKNYSLNTNNLGQNIENTVYNNNPTKAKPKRQAKTSLLENVLESISSLLDK